MPPRAVPLAYAGKKLTGPPEGYDRKKELQVKKWLTNVPPRSSADADLAASVASASEIGGQLDPTLDDLFDDLRDSTDGDAVLRATRPGGPIPKPPKQAPRPVTPADGVSATPGGTAATASLHVAPAGTASSTPTVSAQYTAAAVPSSTSAADGSAKPAMSAAAGLPGSDKGSTPPSAVCQPTTGFTLPVPGRTAGTADSYTSSLSLNPSPADTPRAVTTSGTYSAQPGSPAAHSASPGSKDAAPLDFVVDAGLVDPLLWSQLGMALDDGDKRQAVAVAAGLLVARAEAALAVRAPTMTGKAAFNMDTDKYKAALLMAVREKQRLSEEVRGELVAARAAATAGTQDAAQKAAAAAADAAAAMQRAAAVESQLAHAQAELAKLKQDIKVRRMDAEDDKEAHQAEVSALQAQVATALQRLTAQGDSREAVLRSAQEEAMAARQAAASLDKQSKTLRRQYDLDKARLEMEVAGLQGALSAMETDMAGLRAEKQQAMDAWKAEVAARTAAEESERKALQKAAHRAEVASSLAQARQAAAALKVQANDAAARTQALRDGVQLPVDMRHAGNSNTPVRVKACGTATVDESNTARKATESRPATAPSDIGSSQAAGGAASPVTVGQAMQAASRPRAAAGMVDPARAALQQEFEAVEVQRVFAHRALTHGLAQDKLQLGELQRLQKRALVAAQLEDSKAVTAALAAAPQHLRALSLAFRAFLLAGPQHFATDAASATSAMGPHVLSWLDAAGYRTWADPLLIANKPPPLHVLLPGLDPTAVITAPIVPISAAVVVLAAPGLLSSTLHAAAMNTAATHGVPVHVITDSSSLTLSQLCGVSEQDEAASSSSQIKGKGAVGESTAQAAAAEAANTAVNDVAQLLSTKAMAVLKQAWDARIIVAQSSSKDGNAAVHAAAMQQAPHWAALAARLGMSDTDLQGLPLEQLRKLSVEKTLMHPDLVALNSPRLTHLKVTLAGNSVTPAGISPAAHPAQAAALDTYAAADMPNRSPSKQQQHKHQGNDCRGGMQLQTLLGVLQANTSLTALTLKGVGADVAAARAVCAAVACKPTCCIASITIHGLEVPVGGLLGKAGMPPIQTLDLSRAGESFGPEAAAVLDEALRAPGSAARHHLHAVHLPYRLPNTFNTQQGADAGASLASTLQSLAHGTGGVLQTLNGFPLQRMLKPAATSIQAVDAAATAAGPSNGPAPSSTTAAATLAASSTASSALDQYSVSKQQASMKQASEPHGGAKQGSTSSGTGSAVLDWSGNALGPIVASTLLQHAQANGLLSSQLRALNLTGCCIAPGGASQLSKMLCDNNKPPAAAAVQQGTAAGGGSSLTTVQVACLADNQLGPQGMSCILQALLGPNTSAQGLSAATSAGVKQVSPSMLRVLDLSLNVLCDDGIKLLAGQLHCLPALEVLGLANNSIQVEGARALAVALSAGHMSQLQELRLNGNTLGDAGVAALAAALAKHASITSLHLQENYSVGVEAAKALAALLAATTSLKELLLGNSHLGVEGGKHLGQGLTSNATLTHLDLDKCKLKCGGVTHIAAALHNNRTLQQLNLARNGAGDVGVKAVVEALQAPDTTLTSLDVHGNNLGLVGCRLLGTLLRQHNTSLRCLRLLKDNNQDPDAERPVFKALELLAASVRTLPPPRRVLSTQQEALAGEAGSSEIDGGTFIAAQSTAAPAARIQQRIHGNAHHQADAQPSAAAAGSWQPLPSATLPQGTESKGTDTAQKIGHGRAAAGEGVGKEGAAKDEELEQLLSRYRVPPAAAAAASGTS